MAQDTPTEQPHETEERGRDSKFHYYSGGEVKEIEGTRVSPALWIFWSIVIAGAVLYFLFGGALGPNFGGFKPVGGTKANTDSLQAQLNASRGSNLQYATVDLTQLPIPQGQNINQAIAAGSDVYQTYCIGCHGPNQDGNGVNAASLNPKPRNLHDGPFMQAMSYQRINTSLHRGVPGTAMPRWENTLTETQIGDAIAYVFSLTSPAPGTTPVGQASNVNPTQSGGSKTYVNGLQNSPKPITPAIGGSPAAATSTAPPSLSGTPPGQATNVTPSAAGTGTEENKPLKAESPMAGGASATPPLSAPKPKPSAPVPAGGTGM